MNKLPMADAWSSIAKPDSNPPPQWEGLTSPLDLGEIEGKAAEFYVQPLQRLVGALCEEIRGLRKASERQDDDVE